MKAETYMTIKEKYLSMYMKIAHVVAQRSVAVRKKVGCVIVKDDKIISIGLNGTPAGWGTNVCEYTDADGNLKTKPEVFHAEANACTKLAKSTGGGNGAVAFITCVPCLECAKLLAQSGISRVWYDEEYRGLVEGVNFLRTCNIPTEHLSAE